MTCLLNPIRYVFASCFFLIFVPSTWAQIDTLNAKIEIRRWLEDKKGWMNFTDVYPVIHQSQILYISTQTQEVIRMHFEGCKVDILLELTRRDYESEAHYHNQELKSNYPSKKIRLQLDLTQVKSLYLKTHPRGVSFSYNGEFVQYLKDVYILSFFELRANQEVEQHLLIGKHTDPKLEQEPANRIKQAFHHYVQLCGGYKKRKK